VEYASAFGSVCLYKNKKLKENLKMRQKWKRFVMHVEK